MFAISLEDIEHVLTPRPALSDKELRGMILGRFHYLIPLFREAEANVLAPLRPGIDYQIEIKTKPDGSLEPLP